MKSFENIYRFLYLIKEDLKGFKILFDVDSKIVILFVFVVIIGGIMVLGFFMINCIVLYFILLKDFVVVGCVIVGILDYMYLEVVDGFKIVCEKEF